MLPGLRNPGAEGLFCTLFRLYRIDLPRGQVFAIETMEGEHIGNIGLEDINWKERRATLGIFIGESDLWDQGYGTDAIRTMLGWAFGYLNLNRVALTVYAYNERAIRCYLKSGFQHEGAMRQARYVDGQYYDELMMGILRDEFSEGQETGIAR